MSDLETLEEYKEKLFSQKEDAKEKKLGVLDFMEGEVKEDVLLPGQVNYIDSAKSQDAFDLLVSEEHRNDILNLQLGKLLEFNKTLILSNITDKGFKEPSLEEILEEIQKLHTLKNHDVLAEELNKQSSLEAGKEIQRKAFMSLKKSKVDEEDCRSISAIDEECVKKLKIQRKESIKAAEDELGNSKTQMELVQKSINDYLLRFYISEQKTAVEDGIKSLKEKITDIGSKLHYIYEHEENEIQSQIDAVQGQIDAVVNGEISSHIQN
jgi:hypothetical protein